MRNHWHGLLLRFKHFESTIYGFWIEEENEQSSILKRHHSSHPSRIGGSSWGTCQTGAKRYFGERCFERKNDESNVRSNVVVVYCLLVTAFSLKVQYPGEGGRGTTSVRTNSKNIQKHTEADIKSSLSRFWTSIQFKSVKWGWRGGECASLSLFSILPHLPFYSLNMLFYIPLFLSLFELSRRGRVYNCRGQVIGAHATVATMLQRLLRQFMDGKGRKDEAKEKKISIGILQHFYFYDHSLKLSMLDQFSTRVFKKNRFKICVRLCGNPSKFSAFSSLLSRRAPSLLLLFFILFSIRQCV